MQPDSLAETGPASANTASGLGLALRWQAFRVLDWLSELKSSGTGKAGSKPTNAPPPFGSGTESVWIFVSTIGELNAIEPFLRSFVNEMRPTPVTLLTDRRIYRESFRAKYPNAYVYEIDGTSADVARLLALSPPKLLLIAEIPCLLSDAPCRFPFAAVYFAKRAGARVALINGWIYGYAPSSRLDVVERKVFGRDYLRLMDLVAVQSDAVRNRLIREGADPSRVHVTGNTKFDAVAQQTWSPEGKASEQILQSIVDGKRPNIVAGCVTDFEEQAMILEAFSMVVAQIPNALLVLAPRHPENKAMMTKLEALLCERRLRHLFRSRIVDAQLGTDTQVLILDSMGELKEFYAASTVSYVGRDHNILEPLTFGKPVTISPGWEATYPSYSVYRLLCGTDAVHEFQGPAEHAGRWLQIMCRSRVTGDASNAAAIAEVVIRLKGATSRNLELVKAIASSAHPETQTL